jgi:hypothetical protein
MAAQRVRAAAIACARAARRAAGRAAALIPAALPAQPVAPTPCRCRRRCRHGRRRGPHRGPGRRPAHPPRRHDRTRARRRITGARSARVHGPRASCPSGGDILAVSPTAVAERIDLDVPRRTSTRSLGRARACDQLVRSLVCPATQLGSLSVTRARAWFSYARRCEDVVAPRDQCAVYSQYHRRRQRRTTWSGTSSAQYAYVPRSLRSVDALPSPSMSAHSSASPHRRRSSTSTQVRRPRTPLCRPR